MKQNKIYYLLLIIVSLIYWLFAVIIVKKNNFNSVYFTSFVGAFLINMLDVINGLWIEKLFNAKNLMVNVFGTMLVKMLLYLFFVVLILIFFNIDKLIFVLSLFILYFIVLAIKVSVIHLQKKME
ncbi:MAG TPA: hypothetical protein PLP99_08450 [Ignavibacteriales bacterium]|nr:hypothetical protein [Ignavibacteriales bacterium]HOL81771.1 hypothetical protein [Ignavibacteriales bacterium]HOM65670.1 hypothetical protein [Ignavibacteriales bacterium]HPP32891.1 hypothetical protein [Ignavibacteriales bacterium]HRT99246.1 hypothetical protein [Ignavibacteriales bacterium]